MMALHRCSQVAALMAALAVLLSAPATRAEADAAAVLPEEVRAYLAERRLCEHFLSEPMEGSDALAVERRHYVQDSQALYCAGTDRRLAALRRRYRESAELRAVLDALDPQLEGDCIAPGD